MGMYDNDKDKSILTRDYYASVAPNLPSYRFGRFRRINDPVRAFWYVVITGGVFLVFLLFTLSSVGKAPEITPSTKERQKITSTVSAPQIVLFDDIKAVDDTYTVKNAMNGFYEKTGVIPFIHICKSILANGKNSYSDAELEEYTENEYRTRFDDEEHLMIVLCKNGYTYRAGFYAGKRARELFDAEAMQILSDCFAHYLFEPVDKVHYKNEVTYDDEKIRDALNEASKRIMTVTHNYTPYYIAGGAGVVVLVIIIVEVKSKKRRRGKLVIEKEYLPGEYIPQSVMRISDDENDAYGVKYNYGGERRSVDDIPDSLMRTMWEPTAEMSEKARQNSEMPSAEMPGISTDGLDISRNISKGSANLCTPEHRDNKGGFVYQNPDKPTDESLAKWAQYYNLSSGLADEDESGGFGNSTSVYRDSRGISHLINNRNDEE